MCLSTVSNPKFPSAVMVFNLGQETICFILICIGGLLDDRVKVKVNLITVNCSIFKNPSYLAVKWILLVGEVN